MKTNILNALFAYINKWLNSHGFEVSVVLDTDFFYDLGTDEIHVAIAMPEQETRWFMDFLYEVCGLRYEIDPFLVSLFHEIGHWETENLFSDEEWEDYVERKKQASADTKEDFFLYAHIPQEETASRWAVQFIHENVNDLKEFWQICSKILRYFYTINKVEVN